MNRFRLAIALACALIQALASRYAIAKPARPVGARERPLAAAQTAVTPVPSPDIHGITVTVVEVVAGQAYLKPGASDGVTRGARVTLNRQEYTVAQATDSFAMIVIGEQALRVGESGQARPNADKLQGAVALPKPSPVSRWERAWPTMAPPAASQAPRPLLLGGALRDRRWDVRLSTSVGALLPLQARGDNLARTEVAARIHAEPIAGRLAFDFDGAVQRWFARHLAERTGSEARPTVFVRELRASYTGAGAAASLGRMRYAASTLGTLDGARVSAPLGEGFALAAFGGVLPDPLSGAPSRAATRFGVEATYRRTDLHMRPEAAVVLHGSLFESRLDERRISGAFSVYPGPSRLSAHVELSSFDASNPWKAHAIEVTAAGFDSSLRVGNFQLEGRFDVQQPERSRWLASYLPASWFCTTVPVSGAPAANEACNGAMNTRAYGGIDIGVQFDRLSFTAGAMTTSDLTQSGGANSLGAFAVARMLRIANHLRLEGAASYSRATYDDIFGASVGPGFTMFGEALDLSLHYRLSTLQYRSATSGLVQHGFGGAATVMSGSEWLVAAQGEAITGDDTRALVLLATLTWRPDL